MTLLNVLYALKVFMSLSIMIYAYYILRQIPTDEARPWAVLFVGSMFLFVLELLPTTFVYLGSGLDTMSIALRHVAEFSFMAFMLFFFIYTHQQLVERGVIGGEHIKSLAASLELVDDD
jgi:hypothetical protein